MSAKIFTIVQTVLLDETGDSCYRMRWPGMQLAKQNKNLRIINLDSRAKERFEYALEADLLVTYQSNDSELLPIIKKRRLLGKKTLVEYNDITDVNLAPPVNSDGLSVLIDLNDDGDTSDPGETNGVSEANTEYDKIGWAEGIFKSFNDAPDGMSEELKEFTYSVGAEYLYQDSFAFRLGYFNESPDKGARRFFSMGAGFTYNIIKVDVSYLFSASKVKNPLENTLRFSLSFAFGDKYDEF